MRGEILLPVAWKFICTISSFPPSLLPPSLPISSPFFPHSLFLSFFPSPLLSFSLSSSPSPAANVIWFLCLSGCVSLCLHISSSESSHGTAHMFLQNTVLLSVSVCMCVCVCVCVCVGGGRVAWIILQYILGVICVGSVWESGRRVKSVSMYV